jgi:anti-sigma factor RsiW
MNCELVASLLSDYIDDELNEELREQVSRHLLVCRDCAWEVQSVKETLTALQASASTEWLSEGFRRKLLARLIEEQRSAAGQSAENTAELAGRESRLQIVEKLIEEVPHGAQIN